MWQPFLCPNLNCLQGDELLRYQFGDSHIHLKESDAETESEWYEMLWTLAHHVLVSNIVFYFLTCSSKNNESFFDDFSIFFEIDFIITHASMTFLNVGNSSSDTLGILQNSGRHEARVVS